MIILSLNIMGLGSPSKMLSLDRLVERHKLDVILLDETMGAGQNMIGLIGNILKGWDFLSIYAFENYGGIIIGWKKSIIILNSYFLSSGICTIFFFQDIEKKITMVNFYGPYEARKTYWENLFSQDCVKGGR